MPAVMVLTYWRYDYKLARPFYIVTVKYKNIIHTHTF